MKSIINVVMFLGYVLAWSEELITDVRNQKLRLVTSLVAESYLPIDHPRKLVTLNPKLKSTGAGRYQLFPLVGCLPQAGAGLKDFPKKSGRCGIAAD